MRASHVFLLLALQQILHANAESLDASGVNTKSKRDAAQVVQSPTDPIADLFIGAGGSAEVSPQPVTREKQPIYESWDVLRQYPRYESLPPPSVPEPKTQDPQKEAKEKNDV
jgi:hypothetical protein